MALPDFWDERGLGAVLFDLLEQLHPIDLTVINLQSLAIHVFGIGEMHVSRKRQDLIEKLPEWLMQMVAGQLRMGHI